MPRSSQTVAWDRLSRKRRSWLIEDERRAQALQLALEPFDRRQVEMVRRLVEEQDVGLRRQHLGQRRAAGLAAGEVCGLLVAGQAELLQEIARPVGIVARPEARLHEGERASA